MSKILKAGDITYIEEKILYTKVGQAVAEDEYEDSEEIDSETGGDEEPELPPKETDEQITERIIAEARREADVIIKEAKETAKKEADAITDEAWKQGHQEGMDLASSEGDAIKAQAQKVLQDAEEERKKITESVEAETVELIISITEKLLNNTFQINPAVITALIKQGFSGINLSGDVSVHVSPDDYEAAVDGKDELLTVVESSTHLEIVKDPSLNKMDCVIETPFGNVDCSLNQGFGALKQDLIYLLNGK